MNTQINITETNETNLTKLKTIGLINLKDVSNKEKLVNFAIKIATECIENLDEESLINVCNLKKTF